MHVCWRTEGNVIGEILYTTAEVAELLGGRVCPKTLANWRGLHMGPPWVRYGGRIFYKASGLAAWQDEQQNLSAHEYKSSRRSGAKLQSEKLTPIAPASDPATDRRGSGLEVNASPEPPRHAPPLSKVRRPNLSRRIASSLEAAVTKLQASLADETDQQASLRLVESIGFLNQLLSHKRHADAHGDRQ